MYIYIYIYMCIYIYIYIVCVCIYIYIIVSYSLFGYFNVETDIRNIFTSFCGYSAEGGAVGRGCSGLGQYYVVTQYITSYNSLHPNSTAPPFAECRFFQVPPPRRAEIWNSCGGGIGGSPLPLQRGISFYSKGLRGFPYYRRKSLTEGDWGEPDRGFTTTTTATTTTTTNTTATTTTTNKHNSNSNQSLSTSTLDGGGPTAPRGQLAFGWELFLLNDIYIYICIHVCVYIYIYIYMFTHTYIYIYIFFSLSLYIYIYIYTHTCTYLYTHIGTYPVLSCLLFMCLGYCPRIHHCLMLCMLIVLSCYQSASCLNHLSYIVLLLVIPMAINTCICICI